MNVSDVPAKHEGDERERTKVLKSMSPSLTFEGKVNIEEVLGKGKEPTDTMLDVRLLCVCCPGTSQGLRTDWRYVGKRRQKTAGTVHTPSG